MTKRPKAKPKPKQKQVDAPPAAQEAAPASITNSIDERVAPELSSFFGSRPVSISAFFKSVRNSRIKAFSPSDEEKATELSELNDPAGDRLWSIVAQGNPPSPVYYWMWKVIQDRLKSASDGHIDPKSHDAGKILKDLVSFAETKFKSDDKDEKKAALNLLRLGVAWLIEKRALDPWAAIESLHGILFPTAAEAGKSAVKLIKSGKHGDLKNAIAVSALAKDAVAAAEREARQERIGSSELRDSLTSAHTEIRALKATIERIKQELENTTAQLASVQAKYDVDRQHWGHDLTETKMSQKVLVRERVLPSLQDAVDALEIEPAEPRIALRRLKTVLSILDEASQ